MKLKNGLLAFFLITASLVSAQEKEITLEEIWNGTFRQERLQSLQSLNNGEEYVVLNFDRERRTSSIDVYSYKTGEKNRTLVTSANLEDIEYFSDFEFSEDESKIILATEVEPIYRRSSRGIYYVYDLENETLTKISENKIQEPALSPDGNKVAYVFENNIYIRDLGSGVPKAIGTTQVTTDGAENKIINGITDWVYEEEFSFVQAYRWNETGEKIAFLRFDESEVPTFSMDIYGRYGEQLYPSQEVIKYPKAGEANSVVTLHMYDVSEKETTQVDLPVDYEYIPRILWTSEPNILSVQTLNRHQNNLNLIFVNAATNQAKVVLNESNDTYVAIDDDLTFLEDNSFIWTSEKSGWNHIYLYDKNGDLINQVTDGNWVVTSYYGFDPETNRIFYQSTENGSINRDVFSIKKNGRKKERLTQKTGTNSADFSADFTYFINSFTSADTPLVYTLHLAKNGKLVRKIQDNSELLEILEPYNLSEKEFSTIHINGNDLNMWMIKPPNFDPNKEYPLFMFQYSGPGSQSVSNRFFSTNDYWYQLLAQEGYIVACVDGRGTGMKGSKFKKVTQY
ncbi:MAG TPA: S9 family peptidase, partial [Salinimicrobium sp.]|nr:S9 family peptidase [Salinimicrobium sp.]